MHPTQSITIFIADDHPVVRDGIRFTLENQDDLLIIGEAENGDGLYESVLQSSPCVLILDLNMPSFPKPTEFVRELSGDSNVAILVLTAIEDTEVSANLIQSGARGYLLKDTLTRSLPEAIRQVAEGGLWIAPKVAKALQTQQRTQPLSPREQEILALVVDGTSTKEIADTLFLSIATVRTHLRNIFAKLGVNSRAELQARARHRLL